MGALAVNASRAEAGGQAAGLREMRVTGKGHALAVGTGVTARTPDPAEAEVPYRAHAEDVAADALLERLAVDGSPHGCTAVSRTSTTSLAFSAARRRRADLRRRGLPGPP